MKLERILIIAVLSGLAFTSCRNNEREIDDENQVTIETDRDIDLRTDQRGINDENSVTERIQRNQNLSTFNEGLTRNQINQDLYRGTTGQTTTTTGQTGTTTAGQTGTTTGQTGTTSGQTGTTTGQTNNQGMTGQGTFTIFAPSNDAFVSLSENERNEWNSTQNRDRNTAAINYLVVEQRITQDQLRQQIQNSNGTHTIRTRQGENLTATLDGNNIVLRDAAGNQARIVESDAQGSNGVIHVIDKVLRPSDATRNDARTGTTGTNTNANRTTN